ncbi:MAG: DUF177 domain-containing protein [Pseudomonadota bacterium]
MSQPNAITEQEWSHFFDVDDLGKEGREELTISASEEECKDIARRINVLRIKDISADLVISRSAGTYHVTGSFTANVTQECVVTLDPIETNLSESVEGWFADKESTVSFAAAKREREGAKSHGEVEILEESDDPEPLIEGIIDLGELVTQHLSLAVPSYPHKEGVEFEVTDDKFKINENSPLKKNPFEALKGWKENR